MYEPKGNSTPNPPLDSQTESDGSLKVTAGIPVRVVPRGQVGGDTHFDEREEGHETEDDYTAGRKSMSRSVPSMAMNPYGWVGVGTHQGDPVGQKHQRRPLY
jgi:hypothetical protein